jgi:hypothetical protein
MAEGLGGFVVGCEMAENQNGFAVEGDSGGFENGFTFAADCFATGWVACVSAIAALPAEKCGRGLLPFDQMDDQFAFRIAIEWEGFLSESEAFHLAAVKGANILEDRVKALLVSGGWFAVGWGVINDVQFFRRCLRARAVKGVDDPEGQGRLIWFGKRGYG